MVQATRDVQAFLQSSPWHSDDFLVGPFGALANATTDEERAQLIRNNSITLFHPVGTARMSPKNASWGVTESKLLVKGTSGLRIVDASIFVSQAFWLLCEGDLISMQPQIPECHPHAVVYMVAERAADLIKDAHNLS